MTHNISNRTFNFCYFDGNVKREINIPVKIPLGESLNELIFRAIKTFKIPYYFYNDLYSSLQKIVEVESVKWYDEEAENELQKLRNSNFNCDFIVKFWEKKFRNETTCYEEPVGTTDEELFSVAYHKLVHSPALETILHKEQAYATSAGTIAEKRRKQIIKLSEKQNEEMAIAVQKFHSMVNESESQFLEKNINNLAAKHFEEQCLALGRLNSEMEALHQNQRLDYRSWLMELFEKQAVCSSPLSSPFSSKKLDNVSESFTTQDHEPWPLLEESFTIHLGSQMKQMHNVRILSANALDFCRIKIVPEGVNQVEPQRLETALALYSSGLSGIVLLIEIGSFEGFNGLAKDFVEACQESTELHFSNLDIQLEIIKNQIKEAVHWRSEKAKLSLNSLDQIKKPFNTKNLKVGDIYITKHSNLSQVHVVFHLLVDDSIKSSDINSRHPVILGLRNVLKTAASYDITTITLPLLLANEMTEEMTVAWCSKRAELVFKCVKGFMIEAAGVGGAEVNNLQFLMPSGISPNVFATLATMLPSIFRVSNPLVVKASSDSQKLSY